MSNATSVSVKQASQPGTAISSDLNALKIRQQAAWSSGDYAVVGTTLQIVGEQLCEALDLRPGSKVLDVAAGNGMARASWAAGPAANQWSSCAGSRFIERRAGSESAFRGLKGATDFRC